jgi:hypothetical protein
MTIQNTDSFLVARGETNYQVSASIVRQYAGSGGGGAVIPFGVGATYGKTGLGEIYTVAYNPFSGWYYLVTNTLTVDGTTTYSGQSVWASTDGTNFVLNSSIGGGRASNPLIIAADDAGGAVYTWYGGTNPGESRGCSFNPREYLNNPTNFDTNPSGFNGFYTGAYGGGFYNAGNTYCLVGNVSAGGNSACYYSTNYGPNWVQSASWTTVTGGTEGVTAYTPRGYSGVGYAVGAVSKKVFKTNDGGINWIALSVLAPTLPGSTAASVVSPATQPGFLVSSAGFYSNDDGLTWQASTGLPAGHNGIANLSYHAASDRFYGTTSTVAGSYGLKYPVVSTDRGVTWRLAAQNDKFLTALLSGGASGRNWASVFNTDLYLATPSQNYNSYIARIDPSIL